MAIKVYRLVNDFKRKYNSFNTGSGKDLYNSDIVNVLNEAYEIYIENTSKLAETDNYYRDVLRQLEIKRFKLKPKKLGDGVYYFEYPENLYKRLNQIAITSCKNCSEKKNIIPRIVQSDDLYEALSDPYRKPDFYWEQLLADDAQNGLYVYTENNLDVDYIYIDYIRKINPIKSATTEDCKDSYIDRNGNVVNENYDFDIDSRYIARKVVDIAIIIASRDTRDYNSLKTQIDNYITLDKLN